MAEIPGTVIGAQIVPSDSTDTYSTHEDTYGKGGYRSVNDITERDAIPSQRRKEGMIVGVLSTSKTYQLVGGITNSDWVEYSTGDINDLVNDIIEISGSYATIIYVDNQINDLQTQITNISGSSQGFDIIESTISAFDTELVIATDDTDVGMIEWNVALTDGTNYRASKIISISDGSNVEYSIYSTTDLGIATDITFDIVIDTSQTALRATNSGGSEWTVKLHKNSIPL